MQKARHRSRAFLALVTTMVLAVFVMLPAQSVSAHAYLDRSDPEAGDIIEDAPEEVRLWFTEPLEPDHSFALLYDATGSYDLVLWLAVGLAAASAAVMVFSRPEAARSTAHSVR